MPHRFRPVYDFIMRYMFLLSQPPQFTYALLHGHGDIRVVFVASATPGVAVLASLTPVTWAWWCRHCVKSRKLTQVGSVLVYVTTWILVPFHPSLPPSLMMSHIRDRQTDIQKLSTLIY